MRQAEPDHLSPSTLFGDLPVLRLRMEYSVDDPELLPGYLGSSWRGVLGWQLQRLCCPFRDRPHCPDCLIREQCPYFVLYERKSSVPGVQDTPRPYVFFPEPSSHAPGNRPDPDGSHVLNITLFGSACRAAPLLWKTIHEAARKGLGRERVRFKVHAWSECGQGGDWQRLPDTDSYRHLQGPHTLRNVLDPPPRSPWRVTLDPPLRLRRQGRYMSEMDWSFVLTSLARRVQLLCAVFNDRELLGREGWAPLKERLEDMAAAVRTKTDTGSSVAWKDWSRYSNRQRRKVPMGGLVGSLVITEAPEELWPWLRLAGLVHVGKGAAMGLGRLQASG
jgi:hypothetical protein